MQHQHGFVSKKVLLTDNIFPYFHPFSSQGKKMLPSSFGALGLPGVIIETTGLADPAPVAQTFFVDDDIEENYTLDGIITVVDAKHIIQHLQEEKPEGVVLSCTVLSIYIYIFTYT